MTDNKRLGPISRIIEHEAYLSVNAISQWLTATICCVLFVILAILDTQLITIADIGVILSQIQVFISIFLTIRVKKWGYVLSVEPPWMRPHFRSC